MPFWKTIETSIKCDACSAHAKVSSVDWTFSVPEIAKFVRKHTFKHRGAHFSWAEDMKPLMAAVADHLGWKQS
jgi:hypothetical protein